MSRSYSGRVEAGIIDEWWHTNEASTVDNMAATSFNMVMIVMMHFVLTRTLRSVQFIGNWDEWALYAPLDSWTPCYPMTVP